MGRLASVECRVFQKEWLIAKFTIYEAYELVGMKELETYAGEYSKELLKKFESGDFRPVERFGNLLTFATLDEDFETAQLGILVDVTAECANNVQPLSIGNEYYQGLYIGYKGASQLIAHNYIRVNKSLTQRVALGRERSEW